MKDPRTKEGILFLFFSIVIIYFICDKLVQLKIIETQTKLIIISFLAVIFLTKILPFKLYYTIDKTLHSKIINLPEWLKCYVNINCKERSCYAKDLNYWENQYNADIDFYSLGHVLFWILISQSEKWITLTHVIIISILWESLEVFLGCLGTPIHGRITDILLNISGFIISKYII